MSADSMETNSQVWHGTPQESAEVEAPANMRADANWLQYRGAWTALLWRAREVRAESRNHRHVAILRRALNQKTH